MLEIHENDTKITILMKTKVQTYAKTRFFTFLAIFDDNPRFQENIAKFYDYRKSLMS